MYENQKNWLNPLSLNKNSIMIFEKLEFMAGLESSWSECKMWSKNPWAMEIKQWAMEPRAMENSNMAWGVIFSPISWFQMGYDWLRPNEAFNLQLPVNDCVPPYSGHEATMLERSLFSIWSFWVTDASETKCI